MNETITWNPVGEALPDADTTVMLSLDDSHDEPTWVGFHDGDTWRDVGGLALEGVIGWAEMPAGMKANG